MTCVTSLRRPWVQLMGDSPIGRACVNVYGMRVGGAHVIAECVLQIKWMDYDPYCIVCWFFKPVFQIQVGGLVLPALLHPQVPPSLALSSILVTQTIALDIVVQVGFQFSMITIITVAILADKRWIDSSPCSSSSQRKDLCTYNPTIIILKNRNQMFQPLPSFGR